VGGVEGWRTVRIATFMSIEIFLVIRQ